MAATSAGIDLAPYIDHTMLDPVGTDEQLAQCCREADRFHFPVVCVYPVAVARARELLQGKAISICTVIGFPTGATPTATKLYEAQQAVEHGASELDVALNFSAIRAGNTDAVYNEVAQLVHETGQPLKAIVEAGLLTDEEKRLAAEIAMDAGAAFVKTNTGWFGGATVADVKALREATREHLGIKAAGGIRTTAQAAALIEAGATRLGTSRGPKLLQQRDTLESVR